MQKHFSYWKEHPSFFKMIQQAPATFIAMEMISMLRLESWELGIEI